MSDDSYAIDRLATGPATIVVVDDGSGIDRLTIDLLWPTQSEIRLDWTTDGGLPTSASGSYTDRAGVSHRLVVTGAIEDARGGDGSDFIQGNSLANHLTGDLSVLGGRGDVLWGGEGSDTLTGLGGADELSGDEDDDWLFGGDGQDRLSGGSGVDVLEGGVGADTLSGGADAGDTVSYAGSAGGVRVFVTFGSATLGRGGDAAGDSIAGFTNVVGSAAGDRITDTNQGTLAFGLNDNAFVGGGGQDTLILGGGDDLGYGGTGNDLLRLGLGKDSCFGGEGDDWLEGGDGQDDLWGGAGDDTLQGGVGQDFMTGGAGADRFRFTDPGESALGAGESDFVIGFSHAQRDVLDLSGIDAIAGTPRNDAFTFVGGRLFSGVAGELRVVVAGTGLRVLGDLDGDRTPDLAIFLSNISTLVAADLDL